MTGIPTVDESSFLSKGSHQEGSHPTNLKNLSSTVTVVQNGIKAFDTSWMKNGRT